MIKLYISKLKNFMDLRRHSTFASAILLVFSAGIAMESHEAVADDITLGVWENNDSMVWRSGFGECWRSGFPDTERNVKCDPQHVAVAETAVTPAPEPPVQVVDSDTGTILYTIDGVHFAFDKSTLRDSAKSTLDEAVRVLRDNRDSNVAIVGHTDSIGSDAYNSDLSDRRARSVYDYLAARDVNSSRLTVYGRGESQPIATNQTDAGRAENRRVDFIVN